MKFNDSGETVEKIQKILIEKGYTLDRFGADGHLGDETWDALQQFAEDHDLKWTPLIAKDVAEALAKKEKTSPTITLPEPDASCYDLSKVIDLTSIQHDPPAPVRGKMKWKIGHSGRVVKRNPKTVTGITVHQTDTDLGVGKARLKKYNGDYTRARRERALEVACHMYAFNEGEAIHTCPFEWYVWQANGLNRTTLGLEIEGKFPGLMEDGEKLAGVELIDAACLSLTYMVEKARAMGMPIKDIYGHRQSSDQRRRDPGEELWRRVVLQYAVPVLKLTPHQDFTVGKGSPIPKVWDPDGVGAY
ncbi:hypothetical protein LCGC14_0884060 [marine sediment metagenome]|uniref:N-acetylmuramoyl-L-alanine amidase domain-containing protein n=1 Tax=marine sediment metagenome TaxID=412755 RepID=A0A0F9S830_9ZZZZ